jgi:hypothetical protein
MLVSLEGVYGTGIGEFATQYGVRRGFPSALRGG